MEKVIAIHGGEAFSDYDAFLNALKKRTVDPHSVREKSWRENLPEDLGEGYDVLLPSMPNKQNSKYVEWKIWFEKYLPFAPDGAHFIGHSQGAMFLAKYLTEEKCSIPVLSVHLVAGAYLPVDVGGDDGGDFFPEAEHLHKLADVTSQIFIYHTPDDFVVPYENATFAKTKIPSANLIICEGRGHFLQVSFPELTENIKAL